MKIFMNILWLVGVLIWSACFALGFNYGQGIIVCAILFVASMALMGTNVFLLNKWTSSRDGNIANAKAKENFCLVVYTALVLVTVNAVAHFITQQTEVRTMVKPSVSDKIKKLKVVFAEEETEGSYLEYISETAMLYKNDLAKAYPDEGTIETKVARFKDDLQGDGKFAKLKDEAVLFLYDCEYSTLNWLPWNITYYLVGLDEKADEWKGKLIALSESNEWVTEHNSTYNPDIITDHVAKKVKQPEISNFGLLSIVVILILQVLILFPYVRGKDWSRSGPRKHKTKDSNGMMTVDFSKYDTSCDKEEEEPSSSNNKYEEF